MNMQKWKSFFQEKKWKNLKKSDWVVIGLIGVLLLVVAMPMEKRKTEEQSAGNRKEQAVSDSSTIDGVVQKSNSEGGKRGTTEDAYVEYLEEKLEAELGQMDGDGDV